MNNTQILEMALTTITASLAIGLTYMVSRLILHIILKKTREEIEMLYDMVDERDDELERYHRMFGPLKDWEDDEWAKNTAKTLFGEDDEDKGEYLTPQQIDERYNGMGPDENDELPF